MQSGRLTFQCAYSDLVFIQGETKNQNNYADNAEVIITEVARKIIQSNHIDPFELRLGLIGTHYPQDNADGEVCYYSFMSNISQFRQCLGQLKVIEGLDVHTSALYTALKMHWRENSTKMVILITDSPPDGIEDNENKRSDSPSKGNAR